MLNMFEFDPKNWTQEQRLTALVAYFDIFGLGLNAELIRQYIFGKSNLDQSQIDLIISKSQFLIRENDKIFLNDFKLNVSETERRDRTKFLLAKAVKWSWIFRHVPFVEFVGVCNYLPLGVAEFGSDIDLFIVTKPGRIFLARVFMTLFLQLMGQRRHNQKIEGRFCLSFYANAENLNFESLLVKPYDIYFMFWIMAILPVYDNADYSNQIIKSNSEWMKKYFDNFEKRISHKNRVKSGKSIITKILEWILKGELGNVIEFELEKYFTARHQRKLKKLPEDSSVEVSSKWLKFHNHDRRRYFRSEFEARLKRLGFIKQT